MNKKFKTMQAVIAVILAVLTVASPVSIMASQQNIAAAAQSLMLRMPLLKASAHSKLNMLRIATNIMN